jgi:hypothetical protein
LKGGGGMGIESTDRELILSFRSSDPDPHCFWKLDPDPH